MRQVTLPDHSGSRTTGSQVTSALGSLRGGAIAPNKLTPDARGFVARDNAIARLLDRFGRVGAAIVRPHDNRPFRRPWTACRSAR